MERKASSSSSGGAKRPECPASMTRKSVVPERKGERMKTARGFLGWAEGPKARASSARGNAPGWAGGVGAVDAGTVDAGTADAGMADAGPVVAGPADAETDEPGP